MERPNHPAISHRVHHAWNNPSKYLLLISGEGRKNDSSLKKFKTNVDKQNQKKICVALATGLSENREIFESTDQSSAPPSGAAWRALLTGA